MKRDFSFFPFKDTMGVSAVEFAILAPVLVLLLIGILEIGIMLVIQNALDGAAREGARYAITGSVSGTSTRSSSIEGVVKQTAQNLSGGIIDSSKLTITTSTYSNFSSAGTSGTAGSYGSGGQALYLIITYEWGALPSILGMGSSVILRGESLLVNENF